MSIKHAGISVMETKKSIEAELAYLLKNRPDTTITWDGFLFSYTINPQVNSLVVYSRMNTRTDTIIYYYDSLSRVSHVKSTGSIWHYDSEKKKGYKLNYRAGSCHYDNEWRLVKVEEEYTGKDLPELYMHWYCYYQDGNVRYYLKYVSHTQKGPYKLDDIFFVHYSDSPKPPSKKQLKKEGKAIFPQIKRVIEE